MRYDPSMCLPCFDGVRFDVAIRSAEKTVNERLAHTPELYLLALSQFSIVADTEVVSSELSACLISH